MAVVDGMNRRTDLTVVDKGQAGAKLDNKVKAEARMGEARQGYHVVQNSWE